MQSYSCVQDRCEQTDSTLFPVWESQHVWHLDMLPDKGLLMTVFCHLSVQVLISLTLPDLDQNLLCDTAATLIHLFVLKHLDYSCISTKFVSPNSSPGHQNSGIFQTSNSKRGEYLNSRFPSEPKHCLPNHEDLAIPGFHTKRFCALD